MAYLKFLPEATVISTFFPMGLFMGYITQYHFAGVENLNIRTILQSSQWWPPIIGCGSAIVTCVLLFVIKIQTRQYRYEHFYLINAAMILFFIAGILFMTVQLPFAPIYMSYIAHGICYVTALSYLNIRMGKTKFRFVRLSVPLVFYIFAVAVGATVVFDKMKYMKNVNSSPSPINDVIGILLVISSIWTIACILILEYNCHYNKLNYKSSLDEDINRENKNFSIFEQKYFLITSKHGNVVAAPQSTVTNRPANSLLFFVFVFLSKCTSLMYFYAPFIFIHHVMSMASLNFDLHSISWFGFAGAIISTLLFFPLTYKIQHFVGLLLKLTYMGLLLIIFSYNYWFAREIMVIMWILFMILGFTYPNCDINILSFINLKYTEIVLTLGYVAFHVTVAVIQYITLTSPHLIIDTSSTFNVMFVHALIFLIILSILIVIGIFIMPNRDYKSLLELQNYINTFNSQNNQQNGLNVQMNEREPINTPITLNNVAPQFPVSTAHQVIIVPGVTTVQHHNIHVPNQLNHQQPFVIANSAQYPPNYNSVVPGSQQPQQNLQPPPYTSNPMGIEPTAPFVNVEDKSKPFN